MGLPQAVLQVLFPLSGAIIARKVPNARLYVLMAYMHPSLVGVIIQYKTRNSGALCKSLHPHLLSSHGS